MDLSMPTLTLNRLHRPAARAARRTNPQRSISRLMTALAVIVAAGLNSIAHAGAATGSETVLYSFGTGAVDGAEPFAPLLLGSDGNLYGTTYTGGTHSAGTVFRMTAGGTLTTLYSFGNGTADGQYPRAGVVQGSDGNFYGTTLGGGANGKGTVFKLTPGGGLSTLYSFGASATDGSSPAGILCVGSDGDFYGTTQNGGTAGSGTIFKITVGGTLTTLYSFGDPNNGATTKDSPADDGLTPTAGLVLTSNGSLYGTTSAGGSAGKGVIYSLSATGSVTIVHSFQGSGSGDGDTPLSELVLGGDGNYYGTTEYGGANNDGTVFSLVSGSTTETVIYSFAGAPADGSNPRGGLGLVTDLLNGWSLYGTTQIGGTNNAGTAYSVSSTGTVAVLYNFGSQVAAADGADPQVALVEAGNGELYGTTLSGGANQSGEVFSLTEDGTLTVVHSFGSDSPIDGSNPIGDLIIGTDGNLYGSTSGGGTSGLGTLFNSTTAGVLTSLYSFTSDIGADPVAGLLQASDGSFYGTTLNGGANGAGGVIRFVAGLQPASPLYSFGNQAGDGLNPASALIDGSDGNFYGTTSGGGSASNGTIFQLTPDGTETVVYSFGSASGDGTQPLAGLVQASSGLFYGTTSSGGTANLGTVYSFNASTSALTTLYSFGSATGATDGATPETRLLLAKDGNLYGTTNAGGTSGKGTVFQITTGGTLTTLHSFSGANGDGSNPDGQLIQGTDSNLYGTTNGGGSNGKGTTFQITTAGVLTTLYSFGGTNSDAANPQSGLVQASDGNFYGVTNSGGANGTGALYKLAVTPASTTSSSSSGGGGAIPPGVLLMLGMAAMRRRRLRHPRG